MVNRQEEAHCDVYPQSRCIYVWADENVIEKVRLMPAVLCLKPSVPGAHTANVDPRYNIDEVAKEIKVLAKPPSKWEQLFKIMIAAPGD